MKSWHTLLVNGSRAVSPMPPRGTGSASGSSVCSLCGCGVGGRSSSSRETLSPARTCCSKITDGDWSSALDGNATAVRVPHASNISRTSCVTADLRLSIV